MSFTAYKAVQADTAAALETAVAAQIIAGYQPHGPAFAVTKGSESKVTTLVQAMVQGAPVASDGGAVQKATITLSNAQLLALNATPVELVAAPGAGKLIVPVSYVVEHLYATAAFAGGGNLRAQHAGATPVTIRAAAGLFDQAASTSAIKAGAVDFTGANTALGNKALQVDASVALTAGGGTAKVTTLYTIVDL